MIHGIINVLKPTGMSSHDVIGCLRRIYGMKKMGHAGTLDPLAAGVLPVYAGQATRLTESIGARTSASMFEQYSKIRSEPGRMRQFTSLTWSM